MPRARLKLPIKIESYRIITVDYPGNLSLVRDGHDTLALSVKRGIIS